MQLKIEVLDREDLSLFLVRNFAWNNLKWKIQSICFFNSNADTVRCLVPLLLHLFQERLSLWEEKLNRFEDWDKAPLRPTTTVNTQAAARFIGHSLPHLTTDQKRSMQAISRGEGGSYSGNKRKPQPPRPNKKSVRAATEEFLAKAALELSGHNDSKVKGPIRLLSDEDED